MAENQPDILFIQADQLKPQVLPGYGGKAVTPHLDRLCAEGVVFENAYCNFPLCAPSRFSMLAGMLPSRVRAFDNGAELSAATPTMAHYLRLAGYHTTLSGKQHFVGPDMLHGFHERLVPELYPTDFHWTPSWDEVRMDSNNDSSGVTRSGVCVRSMQMDHDETVLFRAVSRLHDFSRRPDRRPFFLLASFTHPHEPYFALRRHWERYRHEDVPMPATPLLPEPERDRHSRRMLAHHGLLEGDITRDHVRTARHAYLANCSYLDEMIGRLLDTLEATGLSRTTVVLVTSDHGDMLGERGMWFKKHFFDHAARVPLIIHAPSRFAAARRSENVSLVDLLPTLCDLARISVAERAPRPPDGASLVPLCEDPAAARDAPVFAEITSEGGAVPDVHGPSRILQAHDRRGRAGPAVRPPCRPGGADRPRRGPGSPGYPRGVAPPCRGDLGCGRAGGRGSCEPARTPSGAVGARPRRRAGMGRARVRSGVGVLPACARRLQRLGLARDRAVNPLSVTPCP